MCCTHIKEWRVYFQVLGNDIKTKEMPVDALATHSVLVASLVLLAGSSEQLGAFIQLGTNKANCTSVRVDLSVGYHKKICGIVII